MEKKFFAAALALCLALALPPTYALADDGPAGTEYWINMTAEEARELLGAVYDKTETRAIVFVCYNPSTMPNPIQSQFYPYANEKGYYIYNYYTGSGGSIADALAPLFGGSAPTLMPVAVTYNPSTKEYLARDNVRYLNVVGDTGNGINGLLNMMRESGVPYGSSAPSEPGPNPGDDDDGSVSSTPGIHINEQSWEVLRLLNIYRMDLGLQPLSTFKGVQEAANIRAKELFDFCSHTRPNLTGYETVFTDVGILPSLTSWAENIASGQKDAASVMLSWKFSPGHNANMIKPTGRVHAGIGYDYRTDGTPSLYEANWVQNFAANRACSFSSLRLNPSSIEGKPGTDLEALLKAAHIEASAACYLHGASSLPVIAAMCDGYDADDTGDQVITVTYGGQTAALTITGEGHIHEWTVTDEAGATCTAPGSRSSTCAACGLTKAETTDAATGHSFAADAGNGTYACEHGCGTGLSNELAPVYEQLLLDVPQRHDTAASGILDAFLEDYADGVLAEHNIDSYICEVLDGHFIAGNTKYQYRIGMKAAPAPLARTAVYEGAGYLLITEPLTLNLEPGDDPMPEDAPSVAVGANGETTPERPPAPPSEEPDPPVPPTNWPVTPVFPAITCYDISIPKTDGGEVSVSPRSAQRGQTVTVTVQPDSGYALAILEAVDAGGNKAALRDLGGGKYSFTMPASRVTLTAMFEKTEENDSPAPDPGDDGPIPGIGLNPVPMPFTDVQSGDWFYSGVDFVWKHYWMNGVSDTKFAPGETASRAMLWTILARLHGISTAAGPDEAWYERSMRWAMEQGVTDGAGPADGVTREQLAVMLWRDAESPGAGADLNGFGDSGQVSGYARDAMRWAVSNGIIQGDGGMLNPGGTASRAELAVIIARYAGQI